MSQDVLYMDKIFATHVFISPYSKDIGQLYEIPYKLTTPLNGNAVMSGIYERMTKVLEQRGYRLHYIRWGVKTVVVSKIS
jgi:hypothetical protein